MNNSKLETTIAFINEQGLSNLKKEIEDYDQTWFKTRDKTLWKKSTNRKRFLRTKEGTILFSFRIYKNAETKKWFAPVLEEFDLSSKSPIPNFIRKEILNYIDTFGKYKAVKAAMNKLKITNMTISTYYRSLDLHQMEMEKAIKEKPKLQDGQLVYVFLDDAYPTVKNQDVKNITNKKVQKQIRVISFNLGKKENLESKKESLLISKRVGFIAGYVGFGPTISVEDTVQSIKQYGNNFYENFDNAQIIIGGDGDRSFKKIAKELNATLILDKFHSVKYLKDFFIRGKQKYNPQNQANLRHAKELLYLGEFESLMAFLKLFPNRSKVVKYFTNNSEAVVNNSLEYNFGVSVESEVCRLVKAILGFGSKALSDLVFMNMMTMRAFKINNEYDLSA
ncbi:hypothetical protein ELUMI_v1c04750 [Williamsoniiplasma luminosum]|uniref:ISLre2 family transposase n=1 Tax=Williamsoniiplasma luminosum TaxID=214888 RepID=A0A2K8NTT2_9MOLU|nr:UPF0236 family protein [Williamsoniiplasma luminosum]ATZ17199.1 hypothetical protein ELUMI_v1c04750 [Williamsoniiplasma luminosum]